MPSSVNVESYPMPKVVPPLQIFQVKNDYGGSCEQCWKWRLKVLNTECKSSPGHSLRRKQPLLLSESLVSSVGGWRVLEDIVLLRGVHQPSALLARGTSLR